MQNSQVFRELEFDKIRILLSSHCKSEKAKSKSLNIHPFDTQERANKEFLILQEIQAIYADDQLSIPHSDPANIDHALKVLNIENGVLTVDEVVKILKLCWSTKELVQFSKKNQEHFPNIYESCSHIDRFQQVIKVISKVVGKDFKIIDNATAELKKIRNKIDRITSDLQKNFNQVLAQYRKLGLLHETQETYFENKRLLVATSIDKSKIQGKIRGSSSKGNLAYIEPAQNIELNKLLAKVQLEESNEIYRILSDMSDQLRSEKKNLAAFERLLIRFDLYNGKIRLALSYNGIIPKAKSKGNLFWRDAKHPLLLLKEDGQNVVGQDIEMHEKQRFLVISGPNAGGKSITLKTVGIIQLMYQSGLLVPMHIDSEMGWFEDVYTDIGDNQSIENQLSTYSSRLSRMKDYLQNAKETTLLLLDEFGSGSDPELGGALAEVFYEELYGRGCFAVINTHYANIKVLTSKLDEAINACMLFDTKSLKPTYKLTIGQPGSSFTFEVAENNGIAKEILLRAKEKVSQNKLLLDDLSSQLQNEKSSYSKANKLQLKALRESKIAQNKYEKKLEELYNKANQQHRYFEQQSKFQRLGKKIYDLIGKYLKEENNKQLNQEVKKLVAIEKRRSSEKNNAPELEKGLQAPNIPRQPQKMIKTKKSMDIKPKHFKIGDRVRIQGYSKTGVIVSIEGKKINIKMGNFSIQSTLSKIESGND